MKVLVDSTVWSLALRRSKSGPPAQPQVAVLEELIQEGRIVMIGPIRQEVLSGIRAEPHFRNLREKLQAWPDLPIETRDYELAAEFFNRCRARGIQGAHTDFLICAIATNHHLSIFTTDNDFEKYATVLPIKLLRV